MRILIADDAATCAPKNSIMIRTICNSYGNEVGRMWSSFLAILERHCEEHDDCDVVVRSACQTFASLDRWFSHAA
jgi:heme oxygenase